MPGDPVLIRNVGLKGKNKLANKWKKDVYLVVEQPNKQILVYVVKREHGRGVTKMLHRNLLLQLMALPLSKPGVDSTVELSNSSQPSPVEVETVGDNLGLKQGSRGAVYTASTADRGIEQADLAMPRKKVRYTTEEIHLKSSGTPLYSQVNLSGTLRPRVIPSRTRRKPIRQTGGDWVC